MMWTRRQAILTLAAILSGVIALQLCAISPAVAFDLNDPLAPVTDTTDALLNPESEAPAEESVVAESDDATLTVEAGPVSVGVSTDPEAISADVTVDTSDAPVVEDTTVDTSVEVSDEAVSAEVAAETSIVEDTSVDAAVEVDGESASVDVAAETSVVEDSSVDTSIQVSDDAVSADASVESSVVEDTSVNANVSETTAVSADVPVADTTIDTGVDSTSTTSTENETGTATTPIASITDTANQLIVSTGVLPVVDLPVASDDLSGLSIDITVLPGFSTSNNLLPAGIIENLPGENIVEMVSPVTGTTLTPMAEIEKAALAPLTGITLPIAGTIAKPIIEPVAPILEPVLDDAAPVVAGVIAPVAPALEIVTEDAAAVIAPLEPVIEIVAPVIVPVLDAGSPIVDVVAPITGPGLGVIIPLDPIVAPIIEPIAPIVNPVEFAPDAKQPITRPESPELPAPPVVNPGDEIESPGVVPPPVSNVIPPVNDVATQTRPIGRSTVVQGPPVLVASDQRQSGDSTEPRSFTEALSVDQFANQHQTTTTPFGPALPSPMALATTMHTINPDHSGSSSALLPILLAAVSLVPGARPGLARLRIPSSPHITILVPPG